MSELPPNPPRDDDFDLEVNGSTTPDETSHGQQQEEDLLNIDTQEIPVSVGEEHDDEARESESPDELKSLVLARVRETREQLLHLIDDYAQRQAERAEDERHELEERERQQREREAEERRQLEQQLEEERRRREVETVPLEQLEQERAALERERERIADLEELVAGLERQIAAAESAAVAPMASVATLAAPIDDAALEPDRDSSLLTDLRRSFAHLDEANTQSELLSRLLEEATRFAQRSALLLIDSELADQPALKLWNACGFDPPESLELSAPADWQRAFSGHSLRGDSTLGRELTSALDAEDPADVLILPFVLRDQTRALLYVDRASGSQPFSEDALQLLCFAGEQALEVLPLRSQRPAGSLTEPHWIGHLPVAGDDEPVASDDEVLAQAPAHEDDQPETEELAYELPAEELAEPVEELPSLADLDVLETPDVLEAVVEDSAPAEATETAAGLEQESAEAVSVGEPGPETSAEEGYFEPTIDEAETAPSLGVPDLEPSTDEAGPVATDSWLDEPETEPAPGPLDAADAEAADLLQAPELPELPTAAVDAETGATLDSEAATRIVPLDALPSIEEPSLTVDEMFDADARETLEEDGGDSSAAEGENELVDASAAGFELEELDESALPPETGPIEVEPEAVTQEVRLDELDVAEGPPGGAEPPEPVDEAATEIFTAPTATTPADADFSPGRAAVASLLSSAAEPQPPAPPTPPPPPAPPTDWQPPAAPETTPDVDTSAGAVEGDESAEAEPAELEPSEVAAPEPTVEPPPLSGSGEVLPPGDLGDTPGWAFSRSEDTAGEQAHEEAKRLARLLVSELQLYNEEQIDEGRRRGNIYQYLKEDIDKSRLMYDERVDEQVRDSTDYFREELVRCLADGDAQLLGL